MRFSSLLRTSGVLAACAAAAVLSLIPGRAAHAEIIYGITDATTLGSATTNLVAFDSTTPGTLTSNIAISGVVAGQALRAIDFRPSNGSLYAVSSLGTAAQLYTVNLTTGALTTVGTGFTLTGNTSTRVSIDYNPVVDALRVVTGSTQNYRVNPLTGALIAQDTSITSGTLIADVAYSNNVAGATSTTLYAYEYNSDTIGLIGGVNGTPSPNGGVYTSLGSVGLVSEIAAIGFDISGVTGIGYVSLDDFNSPTVATEFYTVNLSTGALTLVGNSPTALLDISARTIAPAAGAPEPGSLTLLGMGLVSGAGTLGIVRRRRKAA